jgi:hypothetical protein
MRWTIGRKLLAGFAAVTLLAIVGDALLYSRATSNRARAEELFNVSLPTKLAGERLRGGTFEVSTELRGYLVQINDPEQREHHVKARRAAWERLDADFAKL